MKELMMDPIRKKQLLFSYITFIFNGMLALSVGSLMPLIRDARGLDYALCGLLVSMHSVGNFCSSFFAGTFAMMLGRKKSILIFNIFFALAFILIIFGGNNLTLIAAFTMTGLARGATSNFNNFTINAIAPGRADIMNGLHAMFSIGAFLFPLILAALTANQPANWIYAAFFMLSMGLLSWILYWLIPVEEQKSERTTQKKTFEFFRDPLFILCTSTLFFYLCAEQGVIGWMVTYFKDTGLLQPAAAQLMASIQWIMILAGRLTVAWAATRVPKTTLLRIMGAGLVAFFLVVITAKSTPQIIIGIMGFGYSMAGIYPTTVSTAGDSIKKSPLAWSFMLTLASLGSILMPSVIGRIADAAGIYSGMASIVVVVIIDMMFILGLTYYAKRQKSRNMA